MRSIDLIDITPDDDALSPEDREVLRSEAQPRGHEALETEKRIEELYAKREELLKRLKEVERGEPQDTPESQSQKAEKKSGPAALVEAFKHNKAFRTKVTGAAAIAIGSIGIIIGAYAVTHNGKSAEAPTPPPAIPTIEVTTPTEEEPEEEVADDLDADESIENTQYAGETINGVRYDYKEYADRSQKEAYNAYGYDYSDQYGDREKATEGILHMAEQEPEALASYAYNIFTDEEKKELGIDGLTMVQIDDKFDEEGGGELQQKILEKFTQILNDEEKTELKFYKENGTEQTNYVYFIDENKDDVFTPEELHLGYDTKVRKDAPQVDIYRMIADKNGKEKSVKMLDLNMLCGYQPNYKTAPEGVQYIPSNQPITPEVLKGGGPNITPPPDTPDTPDTPDVPTPPPKKKWGKSGDPHAGTDYLQTIVTNPAVPDIININDGNQGYVDDGQATPGSASGEYTGGGEDQSDGNMAGENPYHGDDSAGQAVDNSGNQAQEQAQEHNDAGGDNNSDKQEESRVAEGDF